MKVVACHQPNFLPWLGYFYKIKQCDVFILLDDVLVSNSESYFTQTWIKNTNGEKLLLSLPQKRHPVHTFIRDVQCAENHAFFVKKLLKTIDSCYHKAPYFHPHYENLSELLQTPYSFLYEMNVALIRYCASCLHVSCEIRLASELGSTQQKEARILDLVQKVGGQIYLSGKGAKNYQNENHFIEKGIQLQYSDFTIQPYPQLYGKFIGGLSVLDFLFNTNGAVFSLA